ncbi:MAG: type II toxin-antitoxin system HicA family toxin [Anaerolineae bacterium]|nr:type II toxin-antitoxin system HicA family toxin [Anaerolineae bacterium]
MPRLPRISGRACARALEKVGVRFIRYGKGDHMIYRRTNPFAQVSIPDHRELHAGTLRGIITDAGLTVEQFLELL